MRIDPPAISFLEPEGGWRDDDAWVRLFERLLVEKLIKAGLRVTP